jgi:hypothetical protein
LRLEGLGKLKNPMTSSGIEPVTFRLVTTLPRAPFFHKNNNDNDNDDDNNNNNNN